MIKLFMNIIYLFNEFIYFNLLNLIYCMIIINYIVFVYEETMKCQDNLYKVLYRNFTNLFLLFLIFFIDFYY